MFETLFAKLAGKWIGNKLKLEDKMDDTKKWWQSRGVWTGVVTSLMGLYLSLAPQLHLPGVPEWIFALLGAVGVYTRVSATKTIE